MPDRTFTIEWLERLVRTTPSNECVHYFEHDVFLVVRNLAAQGFERTEERLTRRTAIEFRTNEVSESAASIGLTQSDECHFAELVAAQRFHRVLVSASARWYSASVIVRDGSTNP